MTLFISFFAACRLPLRRHGWLIFCNIMITDSAFIWRLWGDNPSNFRELKKFSSIVEDHSKGVHRLYVINSPAISLEIQFTDINNFLNQFSTFPKPNKIFAILSSVSGHPLLSMFWRIGKNRGGIWCNQSKYQRKFCHCPCLAIVSKILLQIGRSTTRQAFSYLIWVFPKNWRIQSYIKFIDGRRLWNH